MDVLTVGLWEAVGTPLELMVVGKAYDKFVIYYDQDDKIQRAERSLVEANSVDEDSYCGVQILMECLTEVGILKTILM